MSAIVIFVSGVGGGGKCPSSVRRIVGRASSVRDAESKVTCDVSSTAQLSAPTMNPSVVGFITILRFPASCARMATAFAH